MSMTANKHKIIQLGKLSSFNNVNIETKLNIPSKTDCIIRYFKIEKDQTKFLDLSNKKN